MRSDEMEIPVAGHSKRLFFSHGISQCGRIKDGVSFWFEGEGCWVVDFDTLRQMVIAAEKTRGLIVDSAPLMIEGQA